MPNYYDNHKATTANSKRMLPNEGEEQHFPQEGLYIGELTEGNIVIPALFDFAEGKGLNLMYCDSNTRNQANRCIERMAWRIALTVPSNLCDIILFNGGKPGDAFATLSRADKYIFDNREDKLFYDGNIHEFSNLLLDVYKSINDRMQVINMEGKENLHELNQQLGDEARLKYRFLFLTDFPTNLTPEIGTLLSKIIESGCKAGVFVILSWDIHGDFAANTQASNNFDANKMLSSLVSIVPHNGRYYFKNSSNDAMLNRFNLALDSMPVDYVAANGYINKIEILVKTTKQKSIPKALKPDYEGLRDDDYVPSINGLDVTVGKDVRDKHAVSFCLRAKDFIHGFVLGQSGSGKSVLLNTIITSIILKYSPQDVMLYLMDFKGVEFNAYRGLKHSKAVLVDNSDLQMTLEVLRELDEEDKRRRKLWVSEEVRSIDGYNAKHPDNRLPQILFVADECQVMFKQPSNESERVALNEITEILVHIAKIGRSQGIHMLLATQQLGEVNIHNDILENLTDCFILRSAARDSERLVPGSSDLTEIQDTGIACYYHQKKLMGQIQTYYATDIEQRAAIKEAQQKAANIPGNGEYYFSGSAEYKLTDDIPLIDSINIKQPTAYLGRNIGIKGSLTEIPLYKDFSENILIVGSNNEGQSTCVAMSALETLIMTSKQRYVNYEYKVIDCYNNNNRYCKNKLEELDSKGLCEVIDRTNSGSILKQLANDIHNQTAVSTILVILGCERFAEMKRNSPLDKESNDNIGGFNFSTDVVTMNFFCNEDGSTDGFEDQISAESERLSTLNLNNTEDTSHVATYPEALRYIIDEGPMQDVHVILQVDKPTNILFEDYPDQTVGMFKHKIILKTENKNLAPMRFSIDIDAEHLCAERERLRAYYYPENGSPQLFTPYQTEN